MQSFFMTDFSGKRKQLFIAVLIIWKLNCLTESKNGGGGGCTVAEIYNCMLMPTEVNSKTHMDFNTAESGLHCLNVPYFLPDGL